MQIKPSVCLKDKFVDVFNYRFARLLITFCLILQSACSLKYQTENQVTTLDAPSNWTSTAIALEALNHWELIGKIGIRTEEDSITAAINQWKQADSSFVIDLSSTFFGLGASRLFGTPHFLTIVESGEEPLSSYNPDLLIYEALGIPLPISSLSWWIKGIPAPNTPYKMEFNEQGQSAHLVQNQWHLSFSKHKMINNLPLPGKIKLERDNIRIILAIKKWTPR